jgi:hypothetical protein
MNPILSASALITTGSGGLIHQLLFVLLVGICVLLIWWVGTWFISKLAAPAIVKTIWDGLFILIGLFVVINFLMSLSGHPLVQM